MPCLTEVADEARRNILFQRYLWGGLNTEEAATPWLGGKFNRFRAEKRIGS